MDAGKRQKLTAVLTAFDARWIILALSVMTPLSTITADVIKRYSPTRLIEKVMNPIADRRSFLLISIQYILGYSRRGNTWESTTVLEHNKAAVKRMLAMVLFVDRAKAAHLVPGQPCLFVKVIIDQNNN